MNGPGGSLRAMAQIPRSLSLAQILIGLALTLESFDGGITLLMPNRSFLGAIVLFAVGLTGWAASPRTALDEYIQTPDPHYSWKVANVIEAEGAKLVVVEMTSQQWLTEKEVNHPIWKHHLSLIVPREVAHPTALLFIGGGSSKNGLPNKPDENLAKVAVATKSVVAELKQVPNQPLIFHNDGKERVEDDLIAYAWDKYLKSGDTKWLPRLPMTKSAVRAMDTITAVCATEQGGKHTVNTFMVAGGSKRGWTTWTTAAVDKRVIAIAPIVIDMLNVVPSFQHHYAVYGFWAPAVGDYVHHGIMEWVNSPEYLELLKIEEPFSYRERYTMPKFVINASGDQFFVPDSAQFYFDQLPAAKYLRYVPNADHSLRKTDAIISLMAFYDSVLNKKKLPEFTWNLPAEGEIRVQAKSKPSKVRLWAANNPQARDFRLDVLGPQFKESELTAQPDGSYLAKVAKPEKGWTAFFVELVYDNKPAPMTFTTEVSVIPRDLPFKDKVPQPGAQPGFLSTKK